MPLTPGSTFERYEIQSLIGRGGMGEVYRAIDTRLHRPVALKVLRTDKDASATVADAGGVARLLREARAAAALNHANSVAIYELGEAEGIAYIAMEFITGVTFRRYLGEGNVSIDTKVSWLVDAARALWAAHRAGLIHRDVKPGNIMVSEEGVVKVLDFGLAKPMVKPDPAAFQTLMGQVLGTPRYMAPEQLEGAPPDGSADQFAFGLTAYELISGTYPGGALAGAPSRLDKVVARASSELSDTIAKMMARAARDRFPTMEDAAHALRACASSLPAVATKPVALSGGKQSVRASDHPTVVKAPVHEPPSTSREIPMQAEVVLEKGKTLPLGMPMKMAMGEGSAALLAPQTPNAFLNKTMPLARPIQLPAPAMNAMGASMPPTSAASSGRLPQEAPSSPRLSGTGPQAPTSGVFPSKAQAAAAARDSRLRVTGPGHKARSRTWIPLLFVGLAAIAAGGVAAWMLH